MKRAHLFAVIGASALALGACGKGEKAAPPAEQANALTPATPVATGTPVPKALVAPASPTPTGAPFIPGGQVVSKAVAGLGAATNAALVPEAPAVGTGKPKLKAVPATSGSAGAAAPFIPGGSVVSAAASGVGQTKKSLGDTGGG